ncbi:MAG: hypothetical protein KDD47_27495, partial [Acidobacteria bacterium]|nr:hypothetical protein [Acidobacteriota bacterium]
MGTERLFDQIDDLLDQVSAIDVTSSEDTGSLSEFVRERPRTLELLQGGEEVLRQVEERFDAAGFKAPGEAPVASDSLFEIGEMISTEMAAQGLADLAFIARGDLRACFQDLRSADARDFWRLASLIDRALRRLRRGLISVESAMCEFEGRKAPIRVWGDLDTSLEIRRTYGELRREAQELDTSEGPDLE